jgi:hypothetical protein
MSMRGNLITGAYLKTMPRVFGPDARRFFGEYWIVLAPTSRRFAKQNAGKAINTPPAAN